jgi:hypothetical protein
MAIALDAFRLLRRIGDHAQPFAAARSEVAKAARSIVVKALKAKSTDLEAVRAIHDATEEDQFALIVEGLSEAEAKSLVARLDKHHPDAKTGSGIWRRRHLIALASGAAVPSASSPKAKKGTKTAASTASKPAAKTASKAAAKEGASAPQPRFKSAVMDVFKHGRRDDD